MMKSLSSTIASMFDSQSVSNTRRSNTANVNDNDNDNDKEKDNDRPDESYYHAGRKHIS
jgi:hypothetical protein